MHATSHPDTMTTQARSQEVASILATALLRCVQQARNTTSSTLEKVSNPLPERLDVPSKTRLNVSQ